MPDKERSSPPTEPVAEKKAPSQQQVVEELREQWTLLWKERFDDKVKAEGISVRTYDRLFVEQGTIIHATRDYKPLNFREVLDKNLVENPDRYLQPPVHIGGWNKFIKTQIKKQNDESKSNKVNAEISKRKVTKGQTKKGGRGWLHSP